MADSGTNFPPQTYSSVFNLNVMTEGDNGLVRGMSSTENETTEAGNPRMRDCFTSSMYWKLFTIILACCWVDTNAIYCTLDAVPKIREFATLAEFQQNKHSFSHHDATYLGSSVNFSFGSVDQLPKNTFNSYTSEYITTIDLSNKHIKHIDSGAFISLSCLYNLDLSNNLISNLTNDAFQGLSNLETLNINKNCLIYISSKVFSSLKSLERLDLSYNVISDINSQAFVNNIMLEILDLSYNSMKHVNYLFTMLVNLRELYLDHNSLAMIPTNLFSKNVLLEKLDLSGNQLVVLRLIQNSFNPEILQVFNLSTNYLMHLNMSCFVNEFSNSKTSIDLNDNQFYCNEWKQYLQEFENNNISIVPGRNFTARYHINGMVCDNLNFTLPGDYVEEIHSLPKDHAVDSKQSDKHMNSSDNYVVQEVTKQNRKCSTPKESMAGNHLTFKYIIIALTVIILAFCIFLTLDYFLNIGFRQKLTRRVRVCLPPMLVNCSVNSFYVQLKSPS